MKLENSKKDKDIFDIEDKLVEGIQNKIHKNESEDDITESIKDLLKENIQNEENKKTKKDKKFNKDLIIDSIYNNNNNPENNNFLNKNKEDNVNVNKNKEKSEIDKLKELFMEDNIENNNNNNNKEKIEKKNKNNNNELNNRENLNSLINNNPKINSNFYNQALLNQLNINQNLFNNINNNNNNINNNKADILFLETKFLNKKDNNKDNNNLLNQTKSNINFSNNQIKKNINININKSSISLANDDIIFNHVFINNDGQKYIPDSDTQIVYDEGKHKFILPEEILKEDDYLKMLRIKALLDSMDFSTLNYKEKFDITDPPIIKGVEKWVKDMKKKENNSDKISTKIIKHEYENSYFRGTKPKTSINTKIKNPPNFRIWG
jgi:hypothetical protein